MIGRQRLHFATSAWIPSNVTCMLRVCAEPLQGLRPSCHTGLRQYSQHSGWALEQLRFAEP